MNTEIPPIVNVAKYLKAQAEKKPFKRAVVYPHGKDGQGRITYAHLTFQQLDEESDKLAFGLQSIGITRGVKTTLMVKPCIDFFVLTYALFKVGAVPVVVDPGMGIKRMIECLDSAEPEAFIGIPLAHVLRTVAFKSFKSVKIWVTVGKKLFWGGYTLDALRYLTDQPFDYVETHANETAAILFTTGSTGPAKGVIYTHGTFDAQVRNIESHFQIADDEIDLPTFPLFALFDPAIGMTAVIPDMDPTKPALVNPLKIIEAIENHGVTNMFASPALLNRVGKFGKEHGVKLPSLRRVVSAGAPVAPANIEQFTAMFVGNTQVHTPYGATEAVPILSIASDEILSETKQFSEEGYGTCIGRPIEDADIKIIKIFDGPIPTWSDDLLAEKGEVGELTVKGSLVTQRYYDNPEADSLAKINEDGETRHRMGDLGWRDNNGRVWFCGRKNHRVETPDGTLFTINCEAIFNKHPDVYRSALVGVGPKGGQTPVIIIEMRPESRRSQSDLKNELQSLAQTNELTKGIRELLFHNSFPVDIRHNSKIFREKLAVYAEEKLGYTKETDL
ncbi:MAG: fatty acid CoA ligase family protein [Desulfobacteraceae bacterium]|jgi:acyl-coenzyme A synthetase/AMP-(fatty) acid ligase